MTLLLTTSGDVDETLEWMRYLNEQYAIFGPDMTLDMFVDQLKELGLVEERRKRAAQTHE